MSDNESVDTRLARIETKLDEALRIQEKHGSAIEKHDKWHYIQVGVTLGSHLLEHAGSLLKGFLGFVFFGHH